MVGCFLKVNILLFIPLFKAKSIVEWSPAPVSVFSFHFENTAVAHHHYLKYLCWLSIMLQVMWCQQRQPSWRIIWLTEVHLYLQITVVEAIELFSQIANSKTTSGSSQMLNNSLTCLGA